MRGPGQAQMDLLGSNPNINSFAEKDENWTVAGLSLATISVQISSTSHLNTFSGVLQGLKLMCESMTQGFEQACLDVKHIMGKVVEKATAHDWEIVWSASADLDNWTATIKPVLECEGVPEAEMQKRKAHAWATGLEITKCILKCSQNIAKVEQAARGTVQSALEKAQE